MTFAAVVPIIAAGLVPLITGYLWYHPRVFGTAWMRMKHITPDMVERNTMRSREHTLVVLALGMVMAYVLSIVVSSIGAASYVQSSLIAIGMWVGIVVPATMSAVLWDHKPILLYAIETGQWLVVLTIMCAVVSM